MATSHVRVPDSLYDRAVKLKDEKDYSTIGEAIRAMAKDAGYDV